MAREDGRLQIPDGAIEPLALAAYRDGFDLRLALDLSLAVSAKRLADRFGGLRG